MNTCHWCGDRHGTDQLCQRAQRGMTRRSFCFLFGAGVAGAMLPTLPVDAWYLDASGKLHVEQANQWTVIQDSTSGPSVATFRSSDPSLRAGRRVAIDFNGQRLFEGVLQEGRSVTQFTAVEYNVELQDTSMQSLLASVRNVNLLKVP